MLKLIQTDYGVFDMVFDAEAMTCPLSAFSTLIYAILFTDAETDATQSPDRYERHGWWFDAAAGTTVWWLRQQPLSPAIRQSCIDTVTNALASHPALSAVTVSDMSAAGNVSTVSLEISALYNNVMSLVQVEL